MNQKKNKKVLILHGQPGMGHIVPAKAIKEIFFEKYPEVEVKDIDTFDFFYLFTKNIYPFFYNFIVAKAPFFWRMFYVGYNNELFRKFLENVVLFFIKKKKFISFIKEFSPDFILATNPVPLQLASLIEEKSIINVLSANVCTDFGFHALWYNPEINYYFVANKEIRELFLFHKVDSDKIKITGIPIRKAFNKIYDRQEIAKELDFNYLNPVLLIVGGQLKYKELLRVIEGIKEKNGLVQFIIVAGRDKILQKELKKSELVKNPCIKIFGLVNNIEKFMSVSDLILSKAGGSTTAECLAKNLPMIIYRTIPGQEEDNVDYLVKNNAGIKVKNVKEIIDIVANLFLNPEKIKYMKENCQKIAKPNATEEIVDFVVKKII